MIRFFKTPSLVRWIYPSFIYRVQAEDSIFLTFDDGPDPKVTPWVLGELERVNAKATFFCLGKNLMESKNLIEKMIIDEHLVANHTFDHLNGLKVSDDEYLANIEKCDRILASFGISNDYFRPPYGKMRRTQIKSLKTRKVTLWSHLAWDFDSSLNVDKCVRALSNVESGSILVFHDSQKAYGNLKQILPSLLDIYRNKGLKMKTLDK